MRQSRLAGRSAVAALLVIALAGCAAAPPRWQYFDADRHPVGGTAANAGYYAGAFVVYPVTVVLYSVVFLLGGRVADPGLLLEPGVPESGIGSSIFGVATGIVLGGPFHLVALPFKSREEDPDLDPDADEPGWKVGVPDGP